MLQSPVWYVLFMGCCMLFIGCCSSNQKLFYPGCLCTSLLRAQGVIHTLAVCSAVCNIIAGYFDEAPDATNSVSAGVLPMSFNDQIAAERLAICNDIGEAAYVDSSVAAVLLERVRCLPSFDSIQAKLTKRLLLPFEDSHTGEDYVSQLSELSFQGDKEQAALRIINQFRQCHLGKFALETPRDVKR